MSSNKAFILAVTGAAVGIGSIWRMPYMIGENGGSVFIVCYLAFILLLGLPAVISEVIIGKVGRQPPILSLTSIAQSSNASTKWRHIGVLGTLGATLILSFYCVVSGWGIYYLGTSFTHLKINQVSMAKHVFNNLLTNPFLVLLFSTIFLILTFGVSAFKINKGIERLNDTLMPLLYLILIVLLIYAMTLPGFHTALHYLLYPDWSKLSTSMLLTAMGMAFFTLATGACCLMAYGAYMPEKQSIVSSVSWVAVINLCVTICAGLSIFSIVFSYGMSASSGPGLIFMALPVALHDMPLGIWVMPLFFFLLIIACWTSSVNLAEPLVTALAHKLSSRRKGALLSGLIVWCLSLIPALSFNLFKNTTIFDKDIFTVYTGFATDVLLPVTGFLILFFTGFIMKKTVFYQHLKAYSVWSRIWYCLIKYISPWCLLLIFIANMVK